MPAVVNGRLKDYKVAVIVTGDSEIPAGMINAISMAGAQVVSKTVLLSNMKLEDEESLSGIRSYYGLGKTKVRPPSDSILQIL